MTKKVNKKETDINMMSSNVAKRVSLLRRQKNLTFDELSKRAAISKGSLVQLEQGGANPSIATLCRLAVALNVSVADLVAEDETTQSPIKIIPAAEARKLWVGLYGGSATLLAGSAGPDMLELWAWELKPKERFEGSGHSSKTREIIHVASGQLYLEIEGQGAIIPTGASALATTDRNHAYANHGKTTVRFFMIVHES